MNDNYYIACFPLLTCMKLKGFRPAFLLAPTNTFFSKNHSCCISTEEGWGRKEANQVTQKTAFKVCDDLQHALLFKNHKMPV